MSMLEDWRVRRQSVWWSAFRWSAGSARRGGDDEDFRKADVGKEADAHAQIRCCQRTNHQNDQAVDAGRIRVGKTGVARKLASLVRDDSGETATR